MLTISEPGISNTIQDAGRWGYQSLGVPVSGAMDAFAFRIANALVRNTRNDAALEIHSPITLQTDRAHLVAVTGDARFTVNERAMPTWMSVFARGGSTIEIAPRRGWAYLAIHGGVAVPRVMSSCATYARGGFGGLDGRALAVGDEIAIGEPSVSDFIAMAGRAASDRARAFANRDRAIRVTLGSHDDWFAPEAFDILTREEFVVDESADRMGYRLRGAILARRAGELVSCGVPLGALQVPADGQPIALMADHQTTGGYPIIATVIGADVALLAQKMPGERVRFQIIAIAEAQRAWNEMESLTI
ncbi:MAG: biotin-dependent carboxyltransferase family protein [Chloroflexi bacterium]|nr:biotin-dependent carboxyltransferase family protein [Chloroflexota bacterium]